MGSAQDASPFQVAVSSDRMTASIVLAPKQPREVFDAGVIELSLDERGVVRSADRTGRIAEAIAAYDPEREEPSQFVVATGKEPKHATDGRFELDAELVKRTGAKDPADSAKGAVDHHQRSRLMIVHTNDLVGLVHPPVAGEDGVDVTGRNLACKQGRPTTVSFDATVKVGKDGVVRAERAGVVEFDEHRLFINCKLDLPGYVDFSTGNVDFPGDVLVRKGVRDCFELVVGGELEVADLIESAVVRAGGNVTLHRGMAGRDKASISAGKDLTAKFLDGVAVEVGRDLTVGKEISNCHVRVGRRLRCEHAAVVGGSVMIAHEGELNQIGSEGNVATEIVLGRIAELERLVSGLVALRPAVEERAAKTKERLEQLQRATVKLTAQQAEELTELQFELASTEGKIAPLNTAVWEALCRIQKHTSPTLTVQRVIHTGVKIWIGNHSAEPRADVKGPLKIWLSETGEPMLTILTSGTSQPLSTICRLMPENRFLNIPELRDRFAA